MNQFALSNGRSTTRDAKLAKSKINLNDQSVKEDGSLSLDSAVCRLFASWRVAGQLFWSVE